jgi:hypothetical protein
MSAVSSSMRGVCLACAAFLVLAVGCGDDDDTTTGGRGGSSASGGAGGSTGGSDTGGNGGSGETGGSTGGAGGTTGGSGGSGGDVVCGGNVCMSTMIGSVTLPACCTTQDTCGVETTFGGQTNCLPSGGGFDAGTPTRPDAGAGNPDPNCPSLSIGPIMIGGCCLADSTCGVVNQFGDGCYSYDYLRQLGLPGVNLPDGGPMSCILP